MFRLRVVAPLLVAGLVSSGVLMGEDDKTDKEPIIVNVKMPTYYSKLNLSKKQKDDLLRVRAKTAAEIEKLNAQINTLKAQIASLKEREQRDLENVLTPEQKTHLKELIAAKGKSKGAKEKPADPNDKPTETKKK